MKLKRLKELSKRESAKIRARQISGTMTEYYDDDSYLCFDEDELKTYKSKKSGRQPKKINKEI